MVSPRHIIKEIVLETESGIHASQYIEITHKHKRAILPKTIEFLVCIIGVNKNYDAGPLYDPFSNEFVDLW